jgi:hypothetical protein
MSTADDSAAAEAVVWDAVSELELQHFTKQEIADTLHTVADDINGVRDDA